MKLNTRAKLTLTILFVVVYMVSAFIWWTYALIDYGVRERNMRMELYSSDSLHLAGEISHSFISGHFKGPNSIDFVYHGKKMSADTSLIKNSALPRYPYYDVHFYENQDLAKTFSVNIKPSVIKKENIKLKRKTDEWLLEGITMGIIMLIIAIAMFIYLDRILRMNQQQNNFLLTVTHELKTPVASAKLAIQTAERQIPSDSGPFKLLKMADNNLERLGKIMDHVLMATRLESINSIYAEQPLILEELVLETLEDIKSSLPEEAVIETHFEPNLTIFGDREMMKMALSNLISNAIKYSNKGNLYVHIQTFVQKDRIALTVTDKGVGIPSSERHRIFKKFYRIGDENTRNSAGTGLGLYLVKKILRQHKAIISMEDNIPDGTVFKIVFRNKL
jgi:signal transduction histidine kinase